MHMASFGSRGLGDQDLSPKILWGINTWISFCNKRNFQQFWEFQAWRAKILYKKRQSFRAQRIQCVVISLNRHSNNIRAVCSSAGCRRKKLRLSLAPNFSFSKIFSHFRWRNFLSGLLKILPCTSSSL